MTNYKDLIKNFTEKDFKNGVNLHIHSTFSDGKASPEKLVELAKTKGYRYISICDHNTIRAYTDTPILNEEIIIPAVEFDCWFKGVFLHLLGYGIDVNCESLAPFLAKTKKETEADFVRIFATRNLKKLIKAIHEANGLAVLAHPACCWAVSMTHFVKELIKIGVDGLEVYYPYNRHRGIIKFHTVKKIEKIADKFNLIKTGGTDCHNFDL